MPREGRGGEKVAHGARACRAACLTFHPGGAGEGQVDMFYFWTFLVLAKNERERRGGGGGVDKIRLSVSNTKRSLGLFTF